MAINKSIICRNSWTSKNICFIHSISNKQICRTYDSYKQSFRTILNVWKYAYFSSIHQWYYIGKINANSKWIKKSLRIKWEFCSAIYANWPYIRELYAQGDPTKDDTSETTVCNLHQFRRGYRSWVKGSKTSFF